MTRITARTIAARRLPRRTQAAGAIGHGKLTGRLAASTSFCVNAQFNRARIMLGRLAANASS
jgi:hypothetical protein